MSMNVCMSVYVSLVINWLPAQGIPQSHLVGSSPLHGKFSIIDPSINYLYCLLGIVGGCSQSQSLDWGRVHPGLVASHHWYIKTNKHSPVNLSSMFLNCGNKSECPERTCKLHGERPSDWGFNRGSFLMWGSIANPCVSMQPEICVKYQRDVFGLIFGTCSLIWSLYLQRKLPWTYHRMFVMPSLSSL